jgi:hypothetical protein
MQICKIRSNIESQNRELDENRLYIINSQSKSEAESAFRSFRLGLVLDTNVFISNLKQLTDIDNKYSKDILFIVPWVILQELDGLKSNIQIVEASPLASHVPSLSSKARAAIQFILNNLEKNSKNFYFETSAQVFF